jgi:hypothetical protein
MLEFFLAIGGTSLVLLLVSLFLGGHSGGGDGHGGDTVTEAGHDVSSDVGHDSTHGFGHDVPLGGGHGDVSVGHHDISMGHHEVGGGEYEGPGPITFQTVTAFLVAFGFGGAISLSAGLPQISSVIIGSGAGFGLGWFVNKIVRFFWRQQADSSVKETDIVGAAAEVVTRIPPDGQGEVSCLVNGKPLTLLATSTDNTEISLSTKVVIVGFDKSGKVFVSKE